MCDQEGVTRGCTPGLTPPYGQQAGSMHPTGMLSCWEYFVGILRILRTILKTDQPASIA